MGGIGEVILVLALMFGGGYGTRYLTEKETVCKTIVQTTPSLYENEFRVKDCREDVSVDCPIDKPRWVISDSEYKNLSGYIKGMRTHLKSKIELINEYNNDKSIKK